MVGSREKDPRGAVREAPARSLVSGLAAAAVAPLLFAAFRRRRRQLQQLLRVPPQRREVTADVRETAKPTRQRALAEDAQQLRVPEGEALSRRVDDGGVGAGEPARRVLAGPRLEKLDGDLLFLLLLFFPAATAVEARGRGREGRSAGPDAVDGDDSFERGERRRRRRRR